MILVTGAGGFLGRRVVVHLRSKKMEVTPLYHGSDLKIADDRWEADLTSMEHMVQITALSQAPQTIIHLAGYIEILLEANPASPLMMPLPGKENISMLYHTNVSATANILNYSLQKGIEHIIYASSQTVYGYPDNEILTEESLCVPLEHYAASKLCGEHVLRVGAKQGVAVTALRFPGLYGEEREQGVVSGFCISALRKGRIKVNVDFPLPIDVIYIDDVVNAIAKTINYGGESWNCLNISTGEPCSLNLLADYIAELVPNCSVEYSKIPQPIVCMDSSKAHTVLGWRALPRRERMSDMIGKLQNSALSV